LRAPWDGVVWLARAAGITARRGREDARGRDTRRRDARGRDSRVWEEDARRGQYRGRGHGWLVDALRCPLRISRDLYHGSTDLDNLWYLFSSITIQDTLTAAMEMLE
jgi:hypothetical protein